jgi:hypothetical protein
MTAHNLTHYTLARAYARKEISAKQLTALLAIYKGFK